MVLCRAKYFDWVWTKLISPQHKLKYLFLIFLFSVFLGERSFAFKKYNYTLGTDDDSLKRVINKDARRASLLSMALPGLGQAYNKNYWYIKIPLIYGAFGGLGYFVMQKNQEYQNYHNELIYRYDHGDTLRNSFLKLTTDQVNIEKIQVKKYRDFFIIGIGIVYLINVIDANVTAHMKTFDVSDKLSLGIAPKAFYCRNSPHGVAGGISLVLNFK
jgi:hypothetical protein